MTELDKLETEQEETNHELVSRKEKLLASIAEKASLEAKEKVTEEALKFNVQQQKETKKKILEEEENLLAFETLLNVQRQELLELKNHFESGKVTLSPRQIPTAVELTRSVFRLSTCPVCCLAFHCYNFMPTSCGHVYHPACIIPLLSNSEPKYVACTQLFHPDWLESWGLRVSSSIFIDLETELGLVAQRVAFTDSVNELYYKDPDLIVGRRVQERERQLQLTTMYTKTSVERKRVLERSVFKARSLDRQCVAFISEPAKPSSLVKGMPEVNLKVEKQTQALKVPKVEEEGFENVEDQEGKERSDQQAFPRKNDLTVLQSCRSKLKANPRNDREASVRADLVGKRNGLEVLQVGDKSVTDGCSVFALSYTRSQTLSRMCIVDYLLTQKQINQLNLLGKGNRSLATVTLVCHGFREFRSCLF